MPRQGFTVGNAAQLFHHQTHVMIVEVNTLLHGLLDRMPVGVLKALLRAGGDFQKTTILGIEALQNSLCNQ
ncbi:Uncharacterised protein [Enterobacter cloacae]|uniref:Uncharacterized protein n=1 Tax=Enterobacter cloacae TaxID=550 RepID=A0A377LR54_ENTCL|nr:Uncharacterised protein [Enterobacter cloacae]